MTCLAACGAIAETSYAAVCVLFASSGGGVLLYLAQEGRGIGFGNKLRAYTLQQEGLDTVDADYTLGFGADERRYDAAVEMLRHLRIDRVQLLTNNPEKVRAVREGGVRVIDRQPLYGIAQPPQPPVCPGQGAKGRALAGRDAVGSGSRQVGPRAVQRRMSSGKVAASRMTSASVTP